VYPFWSLSVAAGSRFGPYEILSPLGAGGMGEVYRARDLRLERIVALKILPQNLDLDPDRLRRFEQEARLASSLSHPNILSVYEFGLQDGVPYLATELLEGETLRQKMKNGPVPLRKAVDWGVQIAVGLAAAHGKGIIHRDLKPDNIFITSDGRVKILDFGLAKLRAGLSGIPGDDNPTRSLDSQAGMMVGTPGYMAPEQIRGGAADHRSDLFALGAILFEMFSGKRAFHGPTSVETLNAVLNADPMEQISFDRLPAALGLIVRRCLEKQPDERFQSARDLAFDLKALAELPPARLIAVDSRRARSVAGGIFVTILLVLIVAGAVWWNRNQSRGTAGAGADSPRQVSIAVLPIENLSRDPEQEYFADGMTEALITDLAKIGALKVISRTSVMQFKNSRKPLRKIADELGVDLILEGSALRAGDRVRITAQLIEAKSDRHLWAESYERDVSDILSLQSEVARTIAREVEVKLTPQEETRLAARRAVDPEAFTLYLKGRYFWNRRNPADLQKGLQYFQKAVEKDPQYAQAYAGLADSYSLLGGIVYHVLPPRDARPRSRALALKAISLDENLAEAHTALALNLFEYDWNWKEAEREYRRAIELNPSYATAHQWYAEFLSTQGRHDDARKEITRARELDPLSPIIEFAVGEQLHNARQYEQAIAHLQAALEVEPDFFPTHFLLGQTFLRSGNFAAAEQIFRKALQLAPNSSLIRASLAVARSRLGDTKGAQELVHSIETMSRAQYVPASHLAVAYLGSGDRENVFRAMERTVEERDGWVVFMKIEPLLDPLRDDPRFIELMRKVGF